MTKGKGFERGGDGWVLTTSQKLAHPIVREPKKAFRGSATNKWSDDGSLFAVWERRLNSLRGRMIASCIVIEVTSK